MKLKKYKKKNVCFYVSREIIIVVLAIILSFLIVNYYAVRFNEIVLPMANAETKKYITMLINNATKGIVFNDNLFVFERENEKIKMINYNTYEATKLINLITNNIQDGLNENEKITEIPLGVIFKNSLFRNFGPRIKVKISNIGDIIGQLETEVKPYGINNALVQVNAHIEVSAMVTLPLNSTEIKVSNMIPISINIISGNIPEAYFMAYK